MAGLYEQNIGVYLLCFRMETYSELLKQFHEQTAPKDFLSQYKSLFDELQMSRVRKNLQLQSKTADLRHLQQEEHQQSTLNETSLSIAQDSRLVCLRRDDEWADQRELRREQAGLEREIEALKSKTIEINSELSIYRSKQSLVSKINVGGGFAVLRQWNQLNEQADLMDNQQLREQQIIHELKVRKQQLSLEIQRLIKNKQATDQLLKRWRRSKQAKVETIKEPQGDTDLHHILRTFHFLSGLAAEYNGNSRAAAQDIKQRYDWQSDFKGSKGELLRQYLQKGQFYDEAAAESLIELYRKLELQLDRNERAHQQATQSLGILEASHDKLNESLRKIHQRKERCTIHALRKYCEDIHELEVRLAVNCDRITKFTTALYELLRRVNAFFKAVERVMDHTEAGKKILRQLPDCKVLSRFEELLFRNPQEQLLEWSGHELYAQVSANSLFRLYGSHHFHSGALEPLDNYEKVGTIAFKKAYEFHIDMFRLLAEYLRIAKSGQSATSSVLEQQYCVQSKGYYRRDNFKLLERLQSEELKRKGLLMRIPINLVADTQISHRDRPAKPFSSTRSLTPRHSAMSRQALKYTDMASKRQQHSLRKQKIRKLFGRLDSLSRSTNRLPAHMNLDCSRMTTRANCSSLSNLQDRARQQRSTVGVVSKSNYRTEGLD